jgi:GST-like protein
MKKIQLLGCQSCGSTIAEIFFSLAGISYEREEVDYDKPGPQRDKLLSLNPLGQVPTIVMPDGFILTETLAVAHYVHRQRPDLKLIPAGEKEYLPFYRWATFLVTSIYPTFTYGDSPEKWVSDAKAAASLRESTDRERENNWRMLEAAAVGPYFLGETFSAIDIYLAVMTNWRPRNGWFTEHCPKIHRIAQKARQLPGVKEIYARDFS